MLLLAAIAGTLSVTPATAGNHADDERVVETDFRGKPPFKRQIVAHDADTELAKTESADATDDDADRVQVVELRGAPPFKRKLVAVEDLETAEFARLETDGDAANTRRGPPGKPTSRR